MTKISLYFDIYLILISLNIIKSSLKFHIPMFKYKCFQHELFDKGTLLIRYDLTGFENYFKNSDQVELFKNIKIFVKDNNGKNIYETELKSRKNKFAVLLNEEGIYQICTRYFLPRRGKELPQSVMMGIKISNFQISDLDNSVKSDEVKDFWKRIKTIMEDMYPSLQAGKKEIEEEDKIAKSIFDSINLYFALSLIQLVIILLISVTTLFNFRNFFKSKSII